MKKHNIYSLAVFYQQKISNIDLIPSKRRYFRDIFKPFMDNAVTIENDRQDVLKLEESKRESELTKLFNEEVEIQKLPEDIFDKLEESNIKMSEAEFNLIENC